jgi:membrane-bound ClpP family serine protease
VRKRKHNSFAAYILIGVGVYFLVRQLDMPAFAMLDSWPVLVIIIGVALLLHSYTAGDYQHLFSGTIVLGIGVHFYGLEHFDFWIDHWAMYLLIIGIAFIIRFLRTKKGWLPGILFTGLALITIFSDQMPLPAGLADDITAMIEKFWPVLFIVTGIILLKKKK